MKSYSIVKKNLLKDRDTRMAYEKLGPEFQLVRVIIETRLKKGMTQAGLARKMSTKQSAIARLESGSYNPTIQFLEKVAKALDARLTVSLT